MSEVIGIGLSNIDLVAHVSDAFLKMHKVRKGLATKFDYLGFARLRADMEQFDAIPGGCAANTICGMAVTGISTRFYGKIGSDSFESLYRASFSEYGVEYNVSAGSQESSQCAVLVTPDGERSFAYTHGASWDLDAADIDEQSLKQAAMLVTEIYMFEFGANSALPKMIFESAQAQKTPLVMKVMDREFAQKYAQKIRALAQAGILNLIVGNHENLPALVGANTLDETLQALKQWECDVVLTANKGGAYFIDDSVQHYPIDPVPNPKNTTGAADQFLAGFLTGRLDGKPAADCIAHGASCARQILMHDTARPPLIHRHSIRF